MTGYDVTDSAGFIKLFGLQLRGRKRLAPMDVEAVQSGAGGWAEVTMWGGRFSEGPSALLRALNDSFAFDRELFAEDVEGSIAWAQALGDAGVLTSDEVEHARRRAALADARRRATPRTCTRTSRRRCANVVGPLAGKLHTGRSRNDQVATDLKLWLKKACDDFDALVTSLARALAQRALDEAATPMPGYTHLKQAEPVTFGHWCLAYVEMLQRDLSRIRRCARARR